MDTTKKKCKNCQSEIDVKAKKCPQCQSDLRNWFARHPILTGLIVFAILAPIIVASSGGDKKSTTSQVATNEQKQESQNLESPKPSPTKITARALADDFDANQVSAEAKWKDKYVEFSATISNITDSGISFSNIATKDFSLTQISCKVEDKSQLLNIKNGQTVTVRGVVDTQTIGVIDVKQCEIIS